MIITIQLTPKASHSKVEGWTLDAEGQKILKVKVTTVPENGKANEALIKLLAKTLHISKSRITLIQGMTSRFKKVEIDIGSNEADHFLNNLM